ncbi:hypothetical protein [Jeotgalibacillus terrae]|uniref:Uncharacterized protein n=1 Tax=Jeotgalibacillus terrae TaxID=587735 RepID=A0ABW5ZI09_9BACL|nr:hypothetical protein [Jeotgalibacillus terrae]MBM7578553.1 hypothetical protein [Jeotgalibacillus terrae]
MTEAKRIQTNAWLLLLMIPLFVMGYSFAVDAERLFWVFEWSYYVLIAALLIFALWNTAAAKGSLKWAAGAIAAFLLQLIVLSLYVGPFTIYAMFFVFYAVTAAVLFILIMAFRKTDRYRVMIGLFIGLSIIMVLYMALIQSLWGVNWM